MLQVVVSVKVYVSGPVSGRDNGNEESFRRMASMLEGLGHTALVPHDVVPEACSWQEAMRYCMTYLPTCDAAVFIDGWRSSHGARLERSVAMACGLECWESRDVLKMVKGMMVA